MFQDQDFFCHCEALQDDSDHKMYRPRSKDAHPTYHQGTVAIELEPEWGQSNTLRPLAGMRLCSTNSRPSQRQGRKGVHAIRLKHLTEAYGNLLGSPQQLFPDWGYLATLAREADQ